MGEKPLVLKEEKESRKPVPNPLQGSRRRRRKTGSQI
jgi:hypothetical protein